MFQYFNLVFNFVIFVLFNYCICLSFCDNQSFEVLFYNNSALEIIENFDTNSSLYNLNKISPRNTTIYNQTKLKSDSVQYPKSCRTDHECGWPNMDKICCPFEKNSLVSVCIYSDFNFCRGNINQECNKSLECEPSFLLYCLPSKDPYIWNKKNVCRCKDGHSFDFNTAKCEVKPKYDSGSAMQIYKITMIFASCCLALILIIFLVCILRKSYCAPRRQVVPLDNTTIPDIFTLFPHIGNYDGGPLADGTLPPFEKPPTYDETLTLIRNEIGIPPPAYRSGNTSSQSSPEISTRILITNPTLFTVSTDSLTNSGTNSSSDESLAGPSGSGTSRQGIDNPAFC